MADSEDSNDAGGNVDDSINPEPEEDSETIASWPYVISFRLVGARDLMKKDWIGKSDPFCRVYVEGDFVHETAVVKDTLNPMWGDVVTVRFRDETERIIFQIWDKDSQKVIRMILPGWPQGFNDDLLGHCSATVSDLIQFYDRDKVHWIPLLNRECKQISGALLLQYHLRKVAGTATPQTLPPAPTLVRTAQGGTTVSIPLPSSYDNTARYPPGSSVDPQLRASRIQQGNAQHPSFADHDFMQLPVPNGWRSPGDPIEGGGHQSYHVPDVHNNSLK